MGRAKQTVTFLNPRTCGIYKNGAPRYKTDPSTGVRTEEIDNQLIEAVELYLAGKSSAGQAVLPLAEVQKAQVLVPMYYDQRYNDAIRILLKSLDVPGVTIGELLATGVITSRGGHGSPGNDQRSGTIPYIKVSDIRGLRINVNPTNLVPLAVAKRMWRGETSGLEAWDVITPNRASSNIGEFAILLPGEERVVVTKEVFVFRIANDSIWDPYYLHWSLSLRAVREQWRRIALMQTNREDCGSRWREIVLPNPPSREWAREKSRAFRDYFTTIAKAKDRFVEQIQSSEYEYVANVAATIVPIDEQIDTVTE